MLSSSDIKNVTFSGAVGGYKKDEVDILLDKVEVDYEKYEKTTRMQEEEIAELKKEIESYKESQNSINAVLLNAQKLADKIVEDAKNKSKEIIADAQKNIATMTEKSQQIANEFDARATAKKEKLELEIADVLKKAENKKELIEHATSLSVKKQQELFDNLKKEAAEFKEEIMLKYKEHLQLLSELPDLAELEPEKAAKIVNDNYDDIDISSSNTEENTDLVEEKQDFDDISSFENTDVDDEDISEES